MSLLREIQTAILNEQTALGPILLKLRFLAARLGDDFLEDWVQHEINGYPNDVPVPSYRSVDLTYTATVENAAVRRTNVQIADAVISSHAGPEWLHHDIREPMSAIDQIIHQDGVTSETGSKLTIPCGNLQLLIADKVYNNATITCLRNEISFGSILKIQSVVRSNILEFTLALEKNIPAAAEIEISAPDDSPTIDPKQVSDISQQIINYGTMTTINSSGDNAQVTVQVAKGDIDGLIAALEQGGIPIEQAKEFAEIAASEPPGEGNSFGEKARAWLGDKLAEGANAAWTVSLDVGLELFKSALKGFLGGA